MLYLVIYQGPTGLKARPVLASRDPEIVGMVADAISSKLKASEPSLTLLKRRDDSGDGA